MDKNQILALVAQKLGDGTIAPADLAPFVKAPTAAPVADAPRSTLASKVLYSLGALIVVIGAGILVADNWDTLGTGGRLLVSLGFAVVAYAFGFVAAERGSRGVASVAYVVSVAMTPLGVAVVFDALFGLDVTLLAQAVAALIAAAFFGFAALRSRLPVPLLGFAGAASWAYYALILHVADRFTDPEALLRAATVVVGFAYAAAAWRPPMAVPQPGEMGQARALRGLFGFLAAGSLIAVAFSFEPEWRVAAGLAVAGAMWFSVAGQLRAATRLSVVSIFYAVFLYAGVWSVLPLALSFLAVYAAIASRSTWTLFIAAAAVVAAVTRVGSELFGDYLNWSLALIAFGFLLIGAGYAAVRLNKEYIAK